MKNSYDDLLVLDEVEKELSKRESILWMSKPRAASIGKQHLPQFLFAIPWTAFSLFWMAGASGLLFDSDVREQVNEMSTFEMIFPLFGLPFLGIGLWMLLKPVLAVKNAGRVLYAVTNERAFEMQLGSGKTITSYYPEDIGRIERSEKTDGSGDVFFTNEMVSSNDGSRTRKVGFVGVENARELEDCLIDLKNLSA